MKEKSNRIEYIDLAKGFCILLVIVSHLTLFYNIDYTLSTALSTFRMPLYFILSGMFFKEYGNFLIFLVKKVNKLLVPYIFFFIVLGVVVPYLMNKLFSVQAWGGVIEDFSDALLLIFSENKHGATQIWFLQALFLSNMIFYGISRMSKGNMVKKFMFTLLAGLCGIGCSILGINLPYYIDTALTSLPFFYFGNFIFRNTRLLSIDFNTYRKKGLAILFVVFSFSLICILGKWSPAFRINGINPYCAVTLYPLGIIGTMMVLCLSNLLKYIPIISFIGRYSIIVLCTHVFLYILNDLFLNRINILLANSLSILDLFWINLFMTISWSILLIPFFIKYLGYFSAQKDLIPLKWIKS